MKSLRLLPSALLLLVPLLTGCRWLGYGTLDYVSSDAHPAQTTGSVATVDVYLGDPGDAMLPPGTLALWVRADDIPYDDPDRPPGAPTYLQFARVGWAAYDSCNLNLRRPVWPQWPYLRAELGPDHSLSAVVLVDDTLENRQGSWALYSSDFFGPLVGFALRCGNVVVPP